MPRMPFSKSCIWERGRFLKISRVRLVTSDHYRAEINCVNVLKLERNQLWKEPL